MANSGERRKRLGGDRVQQLAVVSELLGQRSSEREVELRLLFAGNVAVHLLDLRFESLVVHKRPRVELWQILRPGHLVGGAASPGTHRDLLVVVERAYLDRSCRGA